MSLVSTTAAGPVPLPALPPAERSAGPALPPPSVAATDGSLGRRALHGSAWTMGGYGAGLAIRLAGQIVLTRLLSPPIFGLMTLVGTFLQGLQMFSDVGITPAIIQNKRGEEPAFLNTAWTIQALRGCMLWGCACLIAWPAARFYDRQLVWLIPVAAISAVIAGFNSTALATLNRRLELARLTMLELLIQVINLAVMVTWAWIDRSIWALLAGGLVASLTRLIFSHTMLPGIRNRFHWDAAAARSLFHFGRWIFLSTVLTFLASQSDRLIFGKILPSLHELGVYGVAVALAGMPTQAILKLGSSVVFPAYSQAHSDPVRLASLFGRVRRPLLAWGGVAVAGLIAAGPALIRVLYDSRYHEAGWILQFLTIAAWFQILECSNGAALLAQGATKWVAAGNAAKLLGMVLLVPAGYWIDSSHPFRGAAMGLVLADALRYAVSAFAVQRRKLRGGRLDLGLSAMVAASAVLAILATQWLGGTWLAGRLLLSLAVTGILWLPVGLWVLRSARAARG